MYSVIMDVNGEELRSKIVEESYNAPANTGNYVTIKINSTPTFYDTSRVYIMLFSYLST